MNKVNAIVPETYAADMSKGIDKKVATAILFYSNLLQHLCSQYGFDSTILKAVASTTKGVVMLKRPDNVVSSKDQLTVEFCLGSLAHRLFAPEMEPNFIWNLGVQSPFQIVIVSKADVDQKARDDRKKRD